MGSWYPLGTERSEKLSFRASKLTDCPMRFPDFKTIIRDAWVEYDPTRPIEAIVDVSINVSTNHVFRINLKGGRSIFAKLSYFGTFEHFLEDHTLIHVLGNNLMDPYENFLARSLMKGTQLYTYRYRDSILDAWVVFYNPIRIANRLPARLTEDQITALGIQMARFHRACAQVRHTLPVWSKSMKSDLDHLLRLMKTEVGRFVHRGHEGEIERQYELFLTNTEAIGLKDLPTIPVFVDWNLGNFSVNDNYELFSRWDYDWFRVDNRILDFYFLSRVCSDIGDRSVFSYYASTFLEERFLRFLKAYHAEYPLTEAEVRLLPEAYRFFILNYVVKDGRYFFHEVYATKLQQEAYSTYFPSLETDFSVEGILRELGI